VDDADPASAALQPPSSPPSQPLGSGAIRKPAYFGFYDSSNPGFPDEALAVSSFANTVWLSCGDATTCASRLQEAKYLDMHAVVAIPFPAGFNPSGAVPAFESAWAAHWASFTSVYAPYVADGTIVAFYPWDEPFGQVYPNTAGAAVVTQKLDFIASTVKASFPTAKLAMVFTGSLTFSFLQHGENIIPSGFDWIGIDMYGCFAGCSYTDKTNAANDFTENYAWYVALLEKYLTPTQEVMLLPGTAVFYGGSATQFATLTASAWQPWVTSNTADVESILNIAEHDARVVGVFGFLYQTYYQSANLTGPGVWVGANDPTMAPMLSTLTNFGRSVMGRSYAQPTSLTGALTPGKPVQLVDLDAQKCLVAPSTGTGTAVSQTDCLAATHLEQMWRLVEVSAGQYRIENANNNFFLPTMCLDLQNGSTEMDALLVQEPCVAAGAKATQLWKLNAVAGGYEIQSAASAGCVEAVGGSSADGVGVAAAACASSPAQTWSLNAPAFAMSTAYSNNALWPAANAIDKNAGTDFSSKGFATSANTNGTIFAAWLAAPQTVKQIRIQARMYNGAALGFPASYGVYITAPDNSRWVPVATETAQPDASGRVVIELPAAVKTYGVQIIPKTLGVDNLGHYYFQLAEVQMLGNGLPQ
jgi:hypothetical protein